MSSRTRAWTITTVAAALPVASLFAAVLVRYWPFRFGMIYICEACAQTRVTTKRQLPLLPVTWWTSHGLERETMLSGFLQEEGLVGPHLHSWAGVHGGGNGCTCALGPARGIEWNARDEKVLLFLRYLKQNDSPGTLARWVPLFLNRNTADRVRSMLWRLRNYPTMDQAWRNEKDAMERERLVILETARKTP